MKLLPSSRWFAAWLLLAALIWPALLPAAEPVKDATAVLNGMRLKRWTKDLELTAEQQKQVQALLDAEGKEVAKLNSAENLAPSERAGKVAALHDATYSKMKPLLNATQLEAFEKMLAKIKPKKKANAPVQ